MQGMNRIVRAFDPIEGMRDEMIYRQGPAYALFNQLRHVPPTLKPSKRRS